MRGVTREYIIIGLVATLFLVAAGAHVCLTLALFPPELSGLLPPADSIMFWPSYIVIHPCFSILWGAFIAVAAVQFSRLREWGRATLELAAWLALVCIAVAFFGLVRLAPSADRGADTVALLIAWIAALGAVSVLFILYIVIIRVLRSPKVRAAMVDAPKRA
jgi:hypothetical protein